MILKIRPNLGFWKQLIDYEIKLFGQNSVKIIASNIGPIPDVYESEVKNMQFGMMNPQEQQAQQPAHGQSQVKPIGSQNDLSSSVESKPQGLTLIPQASKLSPRLPNKQSNRAHYTTTYNASYQKP